MATPKEASRVSAAEAAHSFRKLMHRVWRGGERFVVVLGGTPICEIHPAAPAKFSGAELGNLLRSLSKLNTK